MKTFDRIEHVVKQFENGEHLYCVALHNDAGDVLTPRLRADELRVFTSFQSALKDRFNVAFDDKGQLTGRRGQDRWETELFDLLDGELPE